VARVDRVFSLTEVRLGHTNGMTKLFEAMLQPIQYGHLTTFDVGL
jgi:hypothetical protein